MDYSDEQKAYLKLVMKKDIYLEACPGSGKTEVIAEKLAEEMKTWREFPAGIAVLTFCNSAVDTLMERVALKYTSGAKYPHFIGTFDSFILNKIVNPLHHKFTNYTHIDGHSTLNIVDSSSNVCFFTHYGYAEKGKKRACQYDYDRTLETFVFKTGVRQIDIKLNSLVLKDWQLKDLYNAKEKMWSSGFATYKDIEHLAIDILEDDSFDSYINLLVKKYPYFIIDECQDLSEEQIFIIKFLHSKGSRFHFVGDLNQSIYGFRHSNPKKFSSLLQEIKCEKLPLNTNYRSVQHIVDICSSIVQVSKAKGRNDSNESHCFVLQYESSPVEILPMFYKLTEGMKNKVIVARGYSYLDKFDSINYSTENALFPVNFAMSIILFERKTFSSLKKSIDILSEAFKNKFNYQVKPNSFNCPIEVDSALVWRKFLFSVLSYISNSDILSDTTTWSLWTKDLKLKLKYILVELTPIPEISSVLKSITDLKLVSPKGEGDSFVKEYLKGFTSIVKIPRLATIHQVKGETHDATMLVSSIKSGNESHWKDWLKDPNSEAARLAYVASSRPRKVLIWAVKSLSKSDQIKLRNLGFTIV